MPKKTKIFTVSRSADTPSDTEALTYAADVIRGGGLVVFPTETVYGLGANALDDTAAASIYAAKGRPSNNPLIVHLSDKADIPLYCETAGIDGCEAAVSLMPAPFTVILPAKPVIPKTVTGGLSTVAVRVPTPLIARRLIALSGVPIAAPSANLSGKPSPTCVRHVLEDMDGRADVILDGGDCDVGVESTILTLCAEKPTLLRPGGVTYEMLCEKLGDVAVSDAVLNALKPGETVLSPGMMYKHYAPDKPVILLKGGREACLRYLQKKITAERCAVIGYTEDADALSGCPVLCAGTRSDNAAYAARLFAMLRDTDPLDADVVYAMLPADTSGISLAIYNRLLRASGFHVVTLE